MLFWKAVGYFVLAFDSWEYYLGAKRYRQYIQSKLINRDTNFEQLIS